MELPTGELSQALKEWAIVVEALLSGEQILLLRKGGIREQQAEFQVRPAPALLFATYEHQRPELVKAAVSARVQPGPPNSYPAEITFSGWAEVTHSVPLRQLQDVQGLSAFHLWSEQFVQERWAWKPERPLLLLLLRAYRLPQQQRLPYRSRYGGCRSWIELETSLSTGGSQPVLSAQDYQQQATAVLQALPSAVQVDY